MTPFCRGSPGEFFSKSPCIQNEQDLFSAVENNPAGGFWSKLDIQIEGDFVDYGKSKGFQKIKVVA